MDEIQRSLRASLEAGPGEVARGAFFRNLPKDPDALAFWLLIAVRLSQQELSEPSILQRPLDRPTDRPRSTLRGRQRVAVPAIDSRRAALGYRL